MAESRPDHRQMRRRSATSARSRQLWCPTCRSAYTDPWTHPCGRSDPEPTDTQVRAWCETLATLEPLGMTPMVPAPIARVLLTQCPELIEWVSRHGGVR